MLEFRTPAVGRRALGAAAGVLATSLLITSCGGDDKKPATAPSSGAPAAPAAPANTKVKPLKRSLPKKIQIPAIGVSAPISGVGLQPNGEIEVPPLSRPNLAGWWERGITPGQRGPSVIIGHIDANKRPAVFARLKDLKAGDKVMITRRNGSVATFAVQKLERVPKDNFPNEKIYAEDLNYSALRLVTCGGSFNTATGHYDDNIIAYTRQVAA